MVSKDNNGVQGFVREETKWMTSSARLAQLPQGWCNGEHRHVQLIGDGRAAAAASDPPKLVGVTLRAFKQQMLDDKKTDLPSLYSAGPVADFPEPNPQEWEERYDLRGNKLDSDKVRAGKQEEIDWILKQDLFHDVPEQECYERQGWPYTLKWVPRNKDDKARARIVVREIKKAKTEDETLEANDVFSAMPPVESLKALVSHMMTENVDKLRRPLTLSVFDVSRGALPRGMRWGRLCATSFCNGSPRPLGKAQQDDVWHAGCEQRLAENVGRTVAEQRLQAWS